MARRAVLFEVGGRGIPRLAVVPRITGDDRVNGRQASPHGDVGQLVVDEQVNAQARALGPQLSQPRRHHILAEQLADADAYGACNALRPRGQTAILVGVLTHNALRVLQK